MDSRVRTALLAGAALAAGSATAQPAGQKVTGPVATYWMSAQTQTGFGMGMGGGKPSMGGMMSMMMGGGGGGPQKSLILQLGSGRKATGEPAAEHLPPQVLRAGASLPLLTPKIVKPEPREDAPPEMPREFQKPRGKMLIFWGCGQKARPGQPLVIDFAQMAAGKMPPGLANAMRGINVTPMQPPSAGRNATYGEWPNEKTRTQVPGSGSLIGDHTVRGNYSPEIKFALTAAQDFLGPLNLTTNAKAPGGWANLGWNAVSGAQAYLATAIGGGQDQVVLWTSSEIQASAFALPDYISPADLSRLVASKALMGPQTTRCEVPKEVLDAAPQAMVQLAAYGGEANFVYPPRPTDPKVAWNREWAVKVRYRSATGGLLGMAMPGMGGMAGMDDEDERPARRGQPSAPPPTSGKDEARKAIMRGLGLPGF